MEIFFATRSYIFQVFRSQLSGRKRIGRIRSDIAPDPRFVTFNNFLYHQPLQLRSFYNERFREDETTGCELWLPPLCRWNSKNNYVTSVTIRSDKKRCKKCRKQERKTSLRKDQKKRWSVVSPAARLWAERVRSRVAWSSDEDPTAK